VLGLALLVVLYRKKILIVHLAWHTASDVDVNSISISDVTVDQTGRSGVNFNPRVGRRRRRRRRRTDGRDERPVESLDASIKQTAAENGEGRGVPAGWTDRRQENISPVKCRTTGHSTRRTSVSGQPCQPPHQRHCPLLPQQQSAAVPTARARPGRPGQATARPGQLSFPALDVRPGRPAVTLGGRGPSPTVRIDRSSHVR